MIELKIRRNSTIATDQPAQFSSDQPLESSETEKTASLWRPRGGGSEILLLFEQIVNEGITVSDDFRKPDLTQPGKVDDLRHFSS